MDRIEVTSSELKSVGYDPNLGILEVEFRNGGIYRYLDVPQYHYDSLLTAESLGKYFNANIHTHYRYSRLS
ncbi:KTSC domain-containing protein [bacterium]|nr:KTSC domain-containing protein [bacterium]